MSGVLFLPGKSDLCTAFFELIEHKFFGCSKICVCVASDLLHHILCNHICNANLIAKQGFEIEVCNVYDAINFDKDMTAIGKKVAGPAVCKLTIRNILAEMDLGFNGADVEFVDAVYNTIKFLYQQSVLIDGAKLHFPAFCSVGLLAEFMHRWNAYWNERNMIDFFSCLHARINSMHIKCNEVVMITLNLSPYDMLLKDLMLKVSHSRGMVVFSSIDIDWVSAAASKEHPFFYYKQFLTEIDSVDICAHRACTNVC